jgi:hypothetical protein
MTEIIREVDSSNSGLIAVILVVVVAIGGFLVWRYADNKPAQDTNDTINVQVTPPATNPTP